MSLNILTRFCSKTYAFSSPPRISAAIEANKEMELKRLNMSLSEVIDEELKVWTRSAPADLYYERDMENPRVVSFRMMDDINLLKVVLC